MTDPVSVIPWNLPELRKWVQSPINLGLVHTEATHHRDALDHLDPPDLSSPISAFQEWRNDLLQNAPTPDRNALHARTRNLMGWHIWYTRININWVTQTFLDRFGIGTSVGDRVLRFVGDGSSIHTDEHHVVLVNPNGGVQVQPVADRWSRVSPNSTRPKKITVSPTGIMVRYPDDQQTVSPWL